MNLNNRQRILAIIAGAAAAILLCDQLVIEPLIASWKDRTDELASLKKSVAQATAAIDRERVTRSRWENMRTNTLSSKPSEAENQLLKAFGRWAKDSGVSIASLRPQEKKTDEDYMTIECRAEAGGTMAALTRFLFEIEKDPLAIKFDDLEITARGSDAEQLTLGLQVSGLILAPQPNP
jgi:Tfp pilus assembly protein PilO